MTSITKIQLRERPSSPPRDGFVRACSWGAPEHNFKRRHAALATTLHSDEENSCPEREIGSSLTSNI